MKKTAVLIAYLLQIEASQAFVTPSGRHVGARPGYVAASKIHHGMRQSQLYSSSEDAVTLDNESDEVDRLRAMAAKLRAEAAALADEQALMVSQATQKLFAKFDLNGDGSISADELKQGLEKQLKIELSDNRVQQLIQRFDKNGDGVLQLEEFVTVDQMRNQLDAIIRDEKAAALEVTKLAQQEEEAERLREMQMQLFNEGEATSTEKVLSILPYLFPLLDGLQFASAFVLNHPDNPAAQLAALLFTAYRSIPFSGFVGFLLLSSLSNNPTLNKLIRFNLKQAIYLDIALFLPSLLITLFGFVAGAAGVEIPLVAKELASDGVLVALLATTAYASISSLLGVTPDKIPIMSQAVQDRMISPDMFDEQGRYIGRTLSDDEEKPNKDRDA